MKDTLLLNATYEPLKVVSWQRALTLLVLEKVELVEAYEELVRGPNHSYLLPAIVRLRKYQKQNHGVKFSRYNVFRRDGFACQYCGTRPGMSALTFDHVVPRARGGKTEWTNIVTACGRCNNRKADRSLVEARMSLAHPPTVPDHLPLVSLADVPHPSWTDYLAA